MSNCAQWLFDLEYASSARSVDGLVPVTDYSGVGRPTNSQSWRKRGSTARIQFFLRLPRDDRPPIAQAFVFVPDSPANDDDFAELHRRLWSWGGVPLIYRKTAGMVQLFRCAHRPDFEKNGKIVFQPFKTLELAAQIAADPWWDAERLRNGTLWDDPDVCRKLLSSKQAAQKTLINSVRELHEELTTKNILPRGLRLRALGVA